MLGPQLRDDARQGASDMILAQRAVYGTVAAYTFFARHAEGTEGFEGMRWTRDN